MKVLVIGGTRFAGRHVVEEFVASDDDVTVFTRGVSPNPFVDHDDVGQEQGDRNEQPDLERLRETLDPDVVVDMVALVPEQVAMATDVFANVDAYVLVSTANVYGVPEVPLREGETRLFEYTDEHRTDGMPTTLEEGGGPAYGPRKAACDRMVFAAADSGVNAMSVRPSFIYGPYDYTERMDYWIDRVNSHDRLVIPGDGDYLFNQVFAPDLARAIRLVADRGTRGEAYNVADRKVLTRDEMVLAIAEALETDIEITHACPDRLDTVGLAATDFPLTLPFPILLDTGKLSALGWTSTSPRDAIARTVDEHLTSDRRGREGGPDRSLEVELIENQSAP